MGGWTGVGKDRIRWGGQIEQTSLDPVNPGDLITKFFLEAGFTTTFINITDETKGYQIDGAKILTNEGTNNLMIGEEAGNNDVGQNNLFIGYQAGYNNDYTGANQGEKNIYIGYQTGYGGTAATKNTGGVNVGIGHDALYFNTVGVRSVAVGPSSLWSQTSGVDNVGVGLSTSAYNEEGSSNTAIGTFAGFGSSGQSNSHNVFIGYKAAYNITTGSDNVVIGYMAGEGWLDTESDKLIIANSDTATPLIYGDFDAGSLTINGNATVTGDATVTGQIRTNYSALANAVDDQAIVTIAANPGIGMMDTLAPNGWIWIPSQSGAMLFATADLDGLIAAVVKWGTGGQLRLGGGGADPTKYLHVHGDAEVLGNLDVTNGLDVTGAAIISTNLTVNGNTILGNAASDTIILDGDTWWENAGSGLPFGSFYGNEFNQSQAMTQNVEYQVAHASIATGQSNNITTDGNGKFTITKAGKYKVDWAITASHSAVAKHILWGIALDQALQVDGQQHRETIAADKEYNVSGNGIIDVAVGEDIEIGFKDVDDGTPGTALISHMNLTVLQVGG